MKQRRNSSKCPCHNSRKRYSILQCLNCGIWYWDMRIFPSTAQAQMVPIEFTILFDQAHFQLQFCIIAVIVPKILSDTANAKDTFTSTRSCQGNRKTDQAGFISMSLIPSLSLNRASGCDSGQAMALILDMHSQSFRWWALLDVQLLVKP